MTQDTATEPFITYALWGTGDITPENATALLEEYIPDNVGTVYRPERVTRDQKGLRTALAWFESPDFLGEGGAVPSTDLVASLVSDRVNNGDLVFILALWPEVPSHEDFDFIEAAQNEGITVLDLSRAMDFLDLSLYSRPEPTKEEKAAARAQAREEKKRETAKKKLSDEAPPQDALPFEGQDLPVDAGVATEPVAPPVPDHLSTLIDDEARLWHAVEEAKAAFDKAIKEYVETVTVDMIPLRESIEARQDANAAAEQDMTDPPFDGPYVGVDTKEYYWRRSANTFRVAEGKPRRGESVINLTDDEAREKGLI